jgi:hypothetical protein
VNAWESLGAGGLMSLAAAELSELGPWLARRVTKLSARLLLDRRLTQQYDEEWLAGIERTPGKLTPLARAAGIVFLTVPVLNYRYFDDWWACTIYLPVATWNMRLQLQWPRSLTWGASPEVRLERKRYNHALRAECRELRTGPADVKAEALEVLQALLNDPPPWAVKAFTKGSLKHLARLQSAMTSRGYLAGSSCGK